MARFKVVLQKNGFDDQDTSNGWLSVLGDLFAHDADKAGKLYQYELEVCMIEGELSAGHEFTAYETYHPVQCRVTAVSKLSAQLWNVQCESEWRLYSGFFDSAVIDTSGNKRGVHFRYEHEDRLSENSSP